MTIKSAGHWELIEKALHGCLAAHSLYIWSTLQDPAQYQLLQEAFLDLEEELCLHKLHVTAGHHYPLGLYHSLPYLVHVCIWDTWRLTVESACVGPGAKSETIAYKYEPIDEACQHSKEPQWLKACAEPSLYAKTFLWLLLHLRWAYLLLFTGDERGN